MFINYIIVAWRNLVKNRMVSFINILGLTLGLASSVLALLYARHELTFENCHTKADNICKVYLSGDIGELKSIPVTFGPEGDALKSMFPEIKNNSISYDAEGIVRVGDNIFKENDIILADTAYFSIFTIEFIEGFNAPDPQTIVISQKAAQRYFGDKSAVGENITINLSGQKISFLVTGIYKDFPSNTHLRAEFIIPFSLAKRFEHARYMEYYSTNYNTYLLLKTGTNITELNKNIRASYEIPVDIDNICAYLMPVREIRLSGTFENNKGKLIVFLAGGFFMLITSCFNYINLTNILFSTRGKETGIRKVNNAKSYNIFAQFFTDTFLSALIGFNLAIIILKLVIPWFNTIMETHISLKPDPGFIVLGFALFLVTLILSGLYPALRYSFLKPVNLITSNDKGISAKNYSRRILTSFQFFLAVLFIQVMMVLTKQNNYIFSDTVKGYNSDNVICIPGYHWGNLKKVKDELLKNPAIKAVSWGSSIPSFGYGVTNDWKNEHNNEMAVRHSFESDYLDVYGIKLIKGRFFSEEHTSDKENNIVINKKAAEMLEYPDPVNQMMYAFKKQYKIIGVVDNYMSVPPILNIMPLLITKSDDQNMYLSILIDDVNPQATHEYIRSTLIKINPEYPVEIKYHQDILFEQKEAKSYITAGKLMTLFFILTIATSLIGLFGLSVFIAERHRKEVGIRKVWGANVSKIIFKLSKGMLIQVAVVLSIATPVSYLFAKAYLSVYPLHFEPGIFFYLKGGIIGSVILLLTVSWQTWRAAIRNPVEALRYE
jgi:putative ABC transport system permease protein